MPATTSFKSLQQIGLSPEHQRRLNSWIGNIALDLRKDAPNRVDGAGEIRIGSKGSLSINPVGYWYDFEAGVGGRDALTLIGHLQDVTPVEVRAYAMEWLAAHPGNGTFAANTDAEQAEKDPANAAFAAEVLERMQPVALGTAAHTYLDSRGLVDGPLPGSVGYLPTGRPDESAVVGILTTADGEVVAVQLGYLLADGSKSPHEPQRRQFKIDPEKAKTAAFTIPATPLPPLTLSGGDLADIVRWFAKTIFVCEGLEDALSLHRAFPHSEIRGFPGGIGRAVHLKLKRGTKVLVFADGDAPDSQARKSLSTGLDHLIIEGAEVKLATPPLGTDANDLLVQGGVDAIHAVVAAAVPAVLSPRGHYAKAAHTSHDIYEFNRKTLAHDAGIRVTALDRERARLRQKDQPQEDDKPTWATWDESLWPVPITDITGVCDTALNEMKRYVFGHGDELAIVVVWCLLTHFVHHGIIKLAVCPRLAIKAISYRCGKTTLLEAVENLVPRPESHGGAMSEATFRHLVDEHRVSVLIDEADSLFRRHSKDGHLLAMLKSGHRRSTAHTMHMEPSPDGRGWSLHRASTWAALAYTQIGRLFDSAMEDRALSVHLQRARPGEVTAHLVDGASPELRLIRQKFARWAADQTAMPDIAQPDLLYNRDGDNWMPLLRLAHLIGGQWPNLIMSAALRAVGRNEPDIGFSLAGLLHDIREVFGELEQITSKELVVKLPGLEEQSSDWNTVVKGRPINTSWLAKHLGGVETGLSPGETIHPGPLEGERGRHGYTRAQFADAWSRYLSPKKKEDTSTAASETPFTPFTGFTPSPPYRASAIHPENPQSKREGVNPVNPVKGGMRPSAHVFPDGVVPPWEAPPDVATAPAPPAPDAPKTEELW